MGAQGEDVSSRRFHIYLTHSYASSDGRTPAEQVAQILTVAPVLPRSMGQKILSQAAPSRGSPQQAPPPQHAPHGGHSRGPSNDLSGRMSGMNIQGGHSRGPSNDLSGRTSGMNLEAAAPVIARRDSRTREVDQFVDAKQ